MQELMVQDPLLAQKLIAGVTSKNCYHQNLAQHSTLLAQKQLQEAVRINFSTHGGDRGQRQADVTREGGAGTGKPHQSLGWAAPYYASHRPFR